MSQKTQASTPTREHTPPPATSATAIAIATAQTTYEHRSPQQTSPLRSSATATATTAAAAAAAAESVTSPFRPPNNPTRKVDQQSPLSSQSVGRPQKSPVAAVVENETDVHVDNHLALQSPRSASSTQTPSKGSRNLYTGLLFDYALTHEPRLAKDIRQYVDMENHPDGDARFRAAVYDLLQTLEQGQYHLLIGSLKRIWPLGWSTSPKSIFFVLCIETKTQICLQPLRSSPPILSIQGVQELVEKSFPIHELPQTMEDQVTINELTRRREDLINFLKSATSSTDSTIAELLEKYSLENFERYFRGQIEKLQQRMIRVEEPYLELLEKNHGNHKLSHRTKYPVIILDELTKSMVRHHHFSYNEAKATILQANEFVKQFKMKAENPEQRFQGIMKVWLSSTERFVPKKRKDSEPGGQSPSLERHSVKIRKMADPHPSAVRVEWTEQLDANISTPPRRINERRYWTEEEESNLIAGVKSYGIGNWAKILSSFSFNDRRAVDLKDKWRNLTRSGRIASCSD